jgi:heme/copper-type cytochrome/quinol oxidase subunit 3
VTSLSRRAGRATTAQALATEIPAGRSTGWWGMVLFLATESGLFGTLLGSYFYLRFQFGPQWPPVGIERPELTTPLVMTALLVPSSLSLMWAERGIRNGRRWRLRSGLLATLLLGTGFLVFHGLDYARKLGSFTPTTDVYGSLYYVITGLDGVHVLIGLLILAWLLAASTRGRFGPRRHERVRLTALYWQFVVVVWVAILFTVYLSPRL